MKAIISTSTSVDELTDNEFIEFAVDAGGKTYIIIVTDDGLHISARSQIVVTPTGVDSIAVDCA